MVLSDYGKVFDHVDHGHLKDLLTILGVTGNLLLLTERWNGAGKIRASHVFLKAGSK